MALRFIAMVGALASMAACQLTGSTTTCAQIDWINFIEVGSTQYLAGPQAPSALQESELGPVYTHVKFKVSGHVCDPAYRLKDGDAAFLDPGTPVDQVNGHPVSEELAARFNGQLLLYKAVAPQS
jgi:hypothetical protein